MFNCIYEVYWLNQSKGCVNCVEHFFVLELFKLLFVILKIQLLAILVNLVWYRTLEGAHCKTWGEIIGEGRGFFEREGKLQCLLNCVIKQTHKQIRNRIKIEKLEKMSYSNLSAVCIYYPVVPPITLRSTFLTPVCKWNYPLFVQMPLFYHYHNVGSAYFEYWNNISLPISLNH